MKYIKTHEEFNMKYLKTYESYVETPMFFRFSRSKMIDVDDAEITPTVKGALWGSERFKEILIGFGFPDQSKCIHFLDELAFDISLKNLYGEHIYQIIIDDESDLGWSFFIPINDWYYKSNSYYYELKRNVEFQKLHKGEFGQFSSHNEPIDNEDVKATQILIDKGFIGKGKLKDLMSSQFFGKAKVFVWTTDKVKVRNYQQAAKPPKDPKPYVNRPVLTKDDFISSGISPEKIADFWKSDFGRKVQRMRDTADFYLRREEAINQLNNWIKTST